MNIQDYCDILNIELVVRYYPNQDGRWCAKFQNCEIIEGACLRSAHGNGKTPLLAIENYLKEIRRTKIVLDAFGDKRREFVVPESLEAQG